MVQLMSCKIFGPSEGERAPQCGVNGGSCADNAAPLFVAIGWNKQFGSKEGNTVMAPSTARTGFAIMRMVCACCAGMALADGALAQRASNTPPSPTIGAEKSVHAPNATFSRSKSGWAVIFSFADPVTEIQWARTKHGPFKSTGFLRTLDPRTGQAMVIPSAEIGAEPATIYVRYADLKGKWVGPFAFQFDPASEAKR